MNQLEKLEFSSEHAFQVMKYVKLFYRANRPARSFSLSKRTIKAMERWKILKVFIAQIGLLKDSFSGKKVAVFS